MPSPNRQPSRPKRRCLDCARPTSSTRCAPCGRRHHNRYNAGWATTRLAVLDRDGHRCHWCAAPANTVDHVTPLALGGPRLDPRNLVAACLSCNSSRGGRGGGHLTNANEQGPALDPDSASDGPNEGHFVA